MIGSGPDAARRTQFWAGLLCLGLVLALLPAMGLAYVGSLWLQGVNGQSALSAAALVAGPFPLALGALFAWRSNRGKPGPNLLTGAGAALLAIAVYAVAWLWGGRMLL